MPESTEEFAVAEEKLGAGNVSNGVLGGRRPSDEDDEDEEDDC